jgi:hypothetical protein
LTVACRYLCCCSWTGSITLSLHFSIFHFYVIERASKHEANWFVRRGVAPEYKSDCRVFWCSLVKNKNTFPDITIWNPRKKEPMNEHLNMILLSLSLSPSSQYVNPKQNEPIHGHALQCGIILALQLTHCACICIHFNYDTFSTERSPNYDTEQ